MSEAPAEGGRSTGGGSTFTRKLGPLPLWAWMGIGLAVVLVFANWQKSKQAAGTGGGTGGVQSAGGVDASLVPQFVNQVYENPMPPAAPSITVNTVAPPPATQPKPTTVSGAPGSFTTNLPGGLNEWTSTGKYSLNTIAKSHGMTAQQLIAASQAAENNQPLTAYVSKGNLNAPVPAGVQLFIPSANWQTR